MKVPAPEARLNRVARRVGRRGRIGVNVAHRVLAANGNGFVDAILNMKREKVVLEVRMKWPIVTLNSVKIGTPGANGHRASVMQVTRADWVPKKNIETAMEVCPAHLVALVHLHSNNRVHLAPVNGANGPKPPNVNPPTAAAESAPPPMNESVPAPAAWGKIK